MASYKEVAIAAAEEAGQILLDLSSRPIEFKMKGDRDIQAQADIDSERIIINAITDAFPSHSIYSEEAGQNDRKSEY